MDRVGRTERTGNQNNSFIPMNQLANLKLLIAKLNHGERKIFLVMRQVEICILIRMQICGSEDTHTYIHSFLAII